MAAKKNSSTNDSTTDSTENPIQVLKQGTCPTSSGKSTLGYEVGIDESDVIHIRITSNDGGGFFSAAWIVFTDIQAALKAWPEDQGVTSMTFRKISGRSVNTAGFLIAVLCAEGIIQPMGDKKRVHEACDPATFLASVEALQGGSSKKAKASLPAKSKASGKSPASSRKTK